MWDSSWDKQGDEANSSWGCGSGGGASQPVNTIGSSGIKLGGLPGEKSSVGVVGAESH